MEEKNLLKRFEKGDPHIPEILSSLIEKVQDGSNLGDGSTVGHGDLKKLVIDKDHRIINLISSEPRVIRRFDNVDGSKFRVYTGHIDLLGADVGLDPKNRKLYVIDYKPGFLINPGDNIKNDIIEVLPQLIGYGLYFQEILEGEWSIECIAFNKNGGIIFDPNKVFNPAWDFLNGDFTPSHHLMREFRLNSNDLDDYHRLMEPKKIQKYFFTDFKDLVKKNN